MEVCVLSWRHSFFVSLYRWVNRLVGSAFRVPTALASTNVKSGAVHARIVASARGERGPKGIVSTGTKEGSLTVHFYYERLRVGHLLPNLCQDCRFKRDGVDVEACGRVGVVILGRVVLRALYRASRCACCRVFLLLFRQVRGLRAVRGLLFNVITGKADIRGCDVYFIREVDGKVPDRLRRENGCFAVNRVRLTTVHFGGRLFIIVDDYKFGIHSHWIARGFVVVWVEYYGSATSRPVDNGLGRGWHFGLMVRTGDCGWYWEGGRFPDRGLRVSALFRAFIR